MVQAKDQMLLKEMSGKYVGRKVNFASHPYYRSLSQMETEGNVISETGLSL